MKHPLIASFFTICTLLSPAASRAAEIKALPGFQVELIYSVPLETQGSWIAITPDPRGRVIASDQYGGLYRVTPPALGENTEAKVEKLDIKIEGVHGLLYAFDSLYAMVNERGNQGLYRMRAQGDGFAPPEQLLQMTGKGEHGPHSIVPGPDGKSLYLCTGNYSKLPEALEFSRPILSWNEDLLLPRLWDGNGHAKGLLSPGAYIFKTDPDGKKIELFCSGFRNVFDIAFDPNGELFTFDADMEWDIGMPWYRPTRINHCISGGHYGWRSGSGKFPDYYPDMLPPALDIGLSSPTGLLFGKSAKFPAKYQRALYALDWTFGTMYAVHLQADGATFRGKKEEFITGKPLPFTDAIIHPKDGAMYFTIGGRRTQSALYRVHYTGHESTAPATPETPTPSSKIRKELEAFHNPDIGPEAIEKSWPALASKDRFIRFAARVAIERQPPKLWIERALEEKPPKAFLEAIIALTRAATGDPASKPKVEWPHKTSSPPPHPTQPGDAELQNKIIAALSRLDFTKLDADLRLAALRAWQLCFTRLGKPSAEICKSLATKFDPLFPSKNMAENRELIQILVFLDSPSVTAKAVSLLATIKDADDPAPDELLMARNTGYATAARDTHQSRPNRQAIAYAVALRNATAGWNPDLRRSYFSWFPGTRAWKGGNSFQKFIENIRTEALGNFVPDNEKTALDTLSKKTDTASLANLPAPKGPGRAYDIEDILTLTKGHLRARNFENGKAMYSATLCAACHKFAGEGGGIGPDLTGIGSRYTVRDLAENIINPSKIISDQYGSEQITKKDGSLVIGRVVAEDPEKLDVMLSPLAPNTLTTIPTKEIATRKTWDISMMPPGLINSLNEEELKDLLAYLLSAGNPADAAFKK